MESVGLIAAIVFFGVFVAAAMIVFSMVKRTVKLAFRLIIVGVLLIIAVSGAFSLWWFLAPQSGERTPPIKRTR